MRADTPDWTGLEWIFDASLICPCCGVPGQLLLSWAFDRPGPCDLSVPIQPNGAILFTDGDVLTEDFCRISTDCFVRCVMEFPLKGREETFHIGVWGSLSPANFQLYVDMFDETGGFGLDPMFSWLANRTPLDRNLTPCMMEPRPRRQRPILSAKQDTPLGILQSDGLAPADLRGVLEFMGHQPLMRH